MEIIKLLINIIKKILKYFFILLIIGGIIGGGVYFWQQNEYKKESELNLTFFTTDRYDGELVKGIKWTPISTIYANKNAEGIYQSGYSSTGEMFFREVRRNAEPPTVSVYGLYQEEDEGITKDKLFVNVYWIVDCAANIGQEIEFGEYTRELKCNDNGKYLWSSFGWNSPEINDYDIDALGFKYKVSTYPYDMNMLRQNKTLMNYKAKAVN